MKIILRAETLLPTKAITFEEAPVEEKVEGVPKSEEKKEEKENLEKAEQEA